MIGAAYMSAAKALGPALIDQTVLTDEKVIADITPPAVILVIALNLANPLHHRAGVIGRGHRVVNRNSIGPMTRSTIMALCAPLCASDVRPRMDGQCLFDVAQVGVFFNDTFDPLFPLKLKCIDHQKAQFIGFNTAKTQLNLRARCGDIGVSIMSGLFLVGDRSVDPGGPTIIVFQNSHLHPGRGASVETDTNPVEVPVLQEYGRGQKAFVIRFEAGA